MQEEEQVAGRMPGTNTAAAQNDDEIIGMEPEDDDAKASTKGVGEEEEEEAPPEEPERDSPAKVTVGVKRERAPRQQKTQEQWTALEAAYLMDNYPNDDQYKKLSNNLALTTLQVREWFCKRRKKSKTGGDSVGLDGSGVRRPLSGGGRRRRRASGDLQHTNKSELASKIISKAKMLLVEGSEQYPKLEFKDNGPTLALYFDQIPLPAGRGRGGSTKRSARQQERQELSRLLNRVREEERSKKREEIELRKREQEAIRRQRAAEREAERALKMQLKLEMMERKELERQKRMAEKLEKEREIQEMKRLREEERAKARIEKQLMKEELKRKREEELRERKRLREFERLKAAEEKAAAKLLQEKKKQVVEDEDLEREEMALAIKNEQEATGNGMEVEVDVKGLKLPSFPPEEVAMVPFFDTSDLPEMMRKQMSPEVQQDLLMIWKFVRDYSFVTNVKPVPLSSLVGYLACGVESKQLADLHMALLKLLLADVEESHSLVNQEDGFEHKGGQISGLDRVVHNFAKHLGEIWEWHFGSDLLRAQRNYLTWPEVMRQFLVILGYGPERPVLKKKAESGETVVKDDSEGPKMKPPATCRPGTIKGAAWTVLKEAGVEGMTSVAITDKMNELGLRTGSMGGNKTPEASVNGALSRDSFVFEKVGNHKYALRVICSWHRRQLKRKKDLAEGKVVKEEGEEEEEVKEVKSENNSPEKKEVVKNGEKPEQTKLRRGEGWVRKLAVSEYNDLTLFERTACLAALCTAVLECPSLYQQIEAAIKEKDALSKRLREVQREEKKLRQAVATAEATAAANASNIAVSPEREKIVSNLNEAELKAELETTVLEKNDIGEKLQVLTEEINRRPLGLDRRFNRYWYMKLSKEKSDAVLVVESYKDQSLKVIKDKDSLDLLVSRLNPRGARESKLLEALKAKAQDLLVSLPARRCKILMPEPSREFIVEYPTEASAILVKEGKKPPSQQVDYDSKEAKAAGFLVEKLKGDMLDIYQALPADSFESEEWDGPSVWMAKVRSAAALEDLRDILGEFEGAIKDKLLDHDHFNRNPRIIPGAWVPRDLDEDEDAAMEEEGDDVDEEEEDEEGFIGYVAQEGDVSWIPPTTAGLQYRLRCLDAAIAFRKSTKPLSKRVDAYKYIQRDNPLNKDGTNFTCLSATGMAKVMQNYTRDRNMCAFPAFPPVAAVQLVGDFKLDYFVLQKNFKKLCPDVTPGTVVVAAEDARDAAAPGPVHQTTTNNNNNNDDVYSDDEDDDSDFVLKAN
ncbi:homeodomain protein [Chloropicon primus]|nr:homeodomain protein [Chloropicon primus]